MRNWTSTKNSIQVLIITSKWYRLFKEPQQVLSHAFPLPLFYSTFTVYVTTITESSRICTVNIPFFLKV